MKGVRGNSLDPRRRTDIGVAQEDSAGRLPTGFHRLVSWRTGRFYQAGGSLSPAPSALLWGVLPPKISKCKWSTYLRPPCWGLSSAWCAQTRGACFPTPQRSVFRVVSPFEITKFRKSLIEMLFAVPNIVRPRGVRGASKQGQGDGVGVWL